MEQRSEVLLRDICKVCLGARVRVWRDVRLNGSRGSGSIKLHVYSEGNPYLEHLVLILLELSMQYCFEEAIIGNQEVVCPGGKCSKLIQGFYGLRNPRKASYLTFKVLTYLHDNYGLNVRTYATTDYG